MQRGSLSRVKPISVSLSFTGQKTSAKRSQGRTVIQKKKEKEQAKQAEEEEERRLSERELQSTLEAHVATLIARTLGSGACVFFRLVIIKLIGG